MNWRALVDLWKWAAISDSEFIERAKDFEREHIARKMIESDLATV